MKVPSILSNALMTLSKYHPIVIEGMGSFDSRNPRDVAEYIYRRLEPSLSSITKPRILVIQGDPKTERGISAITPIVANLLDIPRYLVCLDPEIDPGHSPNADRENVIVEMKYSQMATVLENHQKGSVQKLQETIDTLLQAKNEKRREIGKPLLKDYYRDYALLQEVTKASCRILCGSITVAHTAEEISEFSVTSFYTAGLELGLMEANEIVSYNETSDTISCAGDNQDLWKDKSQESSL